MRNTYLKYIFCFLIPLISSHAQAFPSPKDISIGGGAVFGKQSMGVIQGNARFELTKLAENWDLYWGGDIKVLFPLHKRVGVSLGVPLNLEYTGWFLRPFVMGNIGFVTVSGSHLMLEGVMGINVAVHEFQGLRIYAGWTKLAQQGVILGGLIFLAW